MRPARALRLLALLLLVGAPGPSTSSAHASTRAVQRISVAPDLGRDRGGVTDIASRASAPALATTAEANTTATAASTRADQWMDVLWWVAFALTASAYVLVLGVLGIRRLRSGQSRSHAWAVPDLPAVAAQTRHVGPHL